MAASWRSLPPFSPEWWAGRLYEQLLFQRDYFDRMDSYYRGEPRHYPWLPAEAREEFYQLLRLTRSNYMGLVVDSMVERLQVEGFRVGGSVEGDLQTWDIWQANDLDSGSTQAILEAAIGGRSYGMVEPVPGRNPVIYIEHPTQTIVEYEPGSGRRNRIAALKVWLDDWTGDVLSTLYLKDLIYKFVSRGANMSTIPGLGETYRASPQWEPREVPSEPWPIRNPLGVVPIVEIPNNPRLLTGGVSEIADVTAIQDRVAKVLIDRMMTQDYGAFPQKWAVGLDLEDENGNTMEAPSAKNRMVVANDPSVQFGQWQAAPLDPYSLAKREDVKDIASRTRTPAQYLLGEMSNVNGATLKASESGLVSKCRQRQRTFGEGFEELMRLARMAAGIGGSDESMETIWRNPEFRTEGELVDALLKLSTIGVPEQALWEEYGFTPQQIERFKEMKKAEAEADPVTELMRQSGQSVFQLPDSPAEE